MKRRKIAFLGVLACGVGAIGMLSGCQSGSVQASAIDPNLEIVLARHDAYVRNDESLSELETRAALRSSFLLGRLMDTALERPERPPPPELEMPQ